MQSVPGVFKNSGHLILRAHALWRWVRYAGLTSSYYECVMCRIASTLDSLAS